MPYRIAVRFAVSGDLRFLSHQDSMRLFERAAVRAALPLRWGQGFNPRPRYSLPLPRPLGIASEDELLVLDLEPLPEPADPADLLARLAGQMPEGIRLIDARAVDAMPQAKSVRYRLDLAAAEAGADLANRAADLLAQTQCVVQRQTDAKGTIQPVDIRPYVEGVNWDPPAGRLTFSLKVTLGGTARPGEVLVALGLDQERLGHRIVREQVTWE